MAALVEYVPRNHEASGTMKHSSIPPYGAIIWNNTKYEATAVRTVINFRSHHVS